MGRRLLALVSYLMVCVINSGEFRKLSDRSVPSPGVPSNVIIPLLIVGRDETIFGYQDLSDALTVSCTFALSLAVDK